MHPRAHIPILVMFTFVFGCIDGRIDTPAQATIVLDLGEIVHQTTDGGQVVCATAAQEAVLLVDNRRRARLPIDRQVSSLAFEDVEVRPGRVRFDVEIRSGSDVVLYSGGQTADIEADGFQVAVSLERRNGILRVCPAEQQAFRSGAWLNLDNVGNRRIIVELPPPPDSCMGDCFEYVRSPIRFELDPGAEAGVSILMSELATGSYTLRLDSDVGPTQVVIRVN